MGDVLMRLVIGIWCSTVTNFNHAHAHRTVGDPQAPSPTPKFISIPNSFYRLYIQDN